MCQEKINVNTNAEPKDSTPNAETLAAFAELEEMIKNPDKYKRYNNMDELRKALEV